MPGTDASATKRGYYYQDIVTALAWVRLLENQTLLVEVAEDYAIDSQAAAEVHQVRDVADPLTLRGAVSFLENAVALIERNKDRLLTFVYRTTAAMSSERAIADRPGGTPGLKYWEQVKSGADSSPLIVVLKQLAAPGGRLATYLKKTSSEQTVEELIKAVTWATNEPSSINLQLELSEYVATVANRELGNPWTDSKHLMSVVIDEVTRTSTLPEKSERRLTHKGLREVLLAVTHKRILNPEYNQLVRDAAFAKNPPVEQVNDDIRRRLETLRSSRFFRESVPEDLARHLADDVAQGGRCEIGDSVLRALALSWCARILAETDESRARALLSEAKSLSPQPYITLVAALLTGRSDVAAARQSIVDEVDGTAQTIRYLLARRSSPSDSIKWLENAGLTALDFDPDGMFLVLWDLLETKQWNAAIVWQEKIPEEAYNTNPALLWGVAHALVASSIPEPMQFAALEGPLVGREIRLSDRPKDLIARQRAAELFRRFHSAAEQLRLPDTAGMALEYSLWLQLKDRLTRATAAAEISQLWESSAHNSRWVPLALAARLAIDKIAVARLIDQRGVRYGALNHDDARARLLLSQAMPADEWIDRWPEIRPYIEPHYSKSFLDFVEITCLQQAGRRDAAQAALDSAIHLQAIEREQLRVAMGTTDDDIKIAYYRDALTQQRTPATMHSLVAVLLKAEKVAEAIDIASELCQLTQDHEDVEGWLQLLKQENRWTEMESFLDKHPEQVEQSNIVAALYLETLVRQGRWGDAKQLNEGRAGLIASRNQFRIQLAILSGNWEDIGLQLEEAQFNSALSIDDKRRYARLATDLSRVSIAKRLTKSVAEASANDAFVLLDCYMLAVRGRWEDDPVTHVWMERAIALSNEDGPIQVKSLNELAEMMPAWRKTTELMGQGLTKAEMFLALVAKKVNRPLASLMLGTAIGNRAERDLRKRSPVGTFAEVARPKMPSTPKIIGIDQTALLTLGYLGLLPRVLSAFDQIWLPHSVGAWLFREHQDIQFHQPSRVFEARLLLNYLAKQQLHLARLEQSSSKELAQRVGDDLAQLFQIALAEASTGSKSFLIRTSPIHLADSLRQEGAEVSGYANVLRSMLELARSLHQHGVLTDEQFARANLFLSRHDNGWPGDETIPMGATLYLDRVAIAYFHELDFLWRGALEADYRLIIHPNVQREAAGLDQLDTASQDIIGVIDDIKRFLVDGQRKRLVSFLRQPAFDLDQDEDADNRFLLMQSIEQQDGVEAVIVDDRAANKFPSFSHEDGTSTLFRTTLDILDWLLDLGAIDRKEWLSLRNDLRRSGFLFIPASASELTSALTASVVRDGVLIESANARAIRESHLLAQASGMLQMSGECEFLINCNYEVDKAFTEIWNSSEDDSDTFAKANWLVEYNRWDGFADYMSGSWTKERLVELDALAIRRMLFNRGISATRRTVYNNWIQSTYLDELEFSHPKVFEAIYAQSYRGLVAGIASTAQVDHGLSIDEFNAVIAKVSLSLVNELPLSVRKRIFEDDILLDRLRLSRSSRITVLMRGEPSFDTGRLYEQAARLYADKATTVVEDEDGLEWKMELRDGIDVVCHDRQSGREFELQHAQLVSHDNELRVSYVKQLAASHGLTVDQVSAWIDEATVGPIQSRRFSALDRDVQNSPQSIALKIREAFRKGGAKVSDLVPISTIYYDRLVIPWQGETSLSIFVASISQRDSAADLAAQARHELMWSAHSSLVPKSAIVRMDAHFLRAFCKELLPSIDLWSLTGLVESVASRPDAHTELIDLIENLLHVFTAELSDDRARLELTVGLGRVVDACLNTSGLFVDAPVFWRRHASLAHAAMIERAVMELAMPVREFAEWTTGFALQFQIATLADLWTEPRWNGFMFAPAQLKQELIGRVLNALEVRRADFAERLEGLAFGANPESLESQRLIYFSSLPGPLEGGSESAKDVAGLLLDQISAVLSDESSSLPVRLVAASHIVSLGIVPPETCDAIALVVRSLDRADVTEVERDRWSPLLTRLSVAAASSRHQPLAAAVMQFIEGRHGIPLELRAYAGISTCGVHEHLSDWVRAVSDYIGRCASLAVSKEDAEYLLHVIRILGDARPLLRPSVAKTLIRLQSLAQRIGY